jgi:hypothetical protein
MSRYLRYFRILWTVLCGVAAVLLIVLWVRGYWITDCLRRSTPSTRYTSVSSEAGSIQVASLPHTPVVMGWDYHRRASLKAPLWRCVLGEFDYISYESSWVVTIPFWLPAIGVLAAGVSPAIPWRFSLRTLLIATTLVAVVLGLVMWAR